MLGEVRIPSYQACQASQMPLMKRSQPFNDLALGLLRIYAGTGPSF
jgi:hypothetical protein